MNRNKTGVPIREKERKDSRLSPHHGNPRISVLQVD